MGDSKRGGTGPPRRSVLHRLGRIADPLIAALIVLALSSVWGALFLVGNEANGTDFYRYWIGARAVSEGWTTNIYSDQGREALTQKSLAEAMNPASRLGRAAREAQGIDGGRVEILGTPFVFTIFGAASTGQYDRDFQFYRVLSVVVYALAILLLCRVVRMDLATTLALLAFFAFFYGPFQTEARLGNVNRLQVGLLALFVWLQSKHGWRPRDVASGAVLGLTFMLKPVVGLAAFTTLALWLMNGRARKALEVAGGAALGAGVAAGASAAFFGSLGCWSEWIGVLPQVLNSQRTSADGNMGLSRLLLESIDIDLSYVLAVVLLGAVLAIGWLSRRPGDDDAAQSPGGGPGSEWPLARRELHETFLGVGLGVAVMWLSMRLAWAYYLLLAVPFVIYSLRSSGPEPGSPRMLGLHRLAALVFLVLLSPVGALITGGVRAAPAVVVAAVLVHYGAGLVQLRRGAG